MFIEVKKLSKYFETSSQKFCALNNINFEAE